MRRANSAKIRGRVSLGGMGGGGKDEEEEEGGGG
jgi:hypothetical protein